MSYNALQCHTIPYIAVKVDVDNVLQCHTMSYIAVKVDVDDAVALAIGALVVELCNLVDCPTQLIVS